MLFTVGIEPRTLGTIVYRCTAWPKELGPILFGTELPSSDHRSTSSPEPQGMDSTHPCQETPEIAQSDNTTGEHRDSTGTPPEDFSDSEEPGNRAV